ncbi:MAG: lipid A deacylase LpxR family protein [Gammaproteobacteria bacterium]|nr:lipid A deacylase LpxR family protein [Gammaproteobacteria bacterium]NNK97743.1 lipid A deacylase LpxR family protein [Xanthomonadales bacterium]
MTKTAAIWPKPSEAVWLFAAFFGLLITAPCTTVADVPETGFWGFQIENDSFGSSNDRYYTNGFEVSFASIESPPRFLEAVSDALPFYHRGEIGIHGYSFGQSMFTPEDTDRADLIVDDRPYAGWLYMQTGIANVYEDTGNKQVINGLGLTVGIVGPWSLADKTQEKFHRMIGVDVPQGWDNQLENELGLNVGYLRKWRQLVPLKNNLQFEISYHGGAVLGNVYTYASAGVMARWGTALENDIGPPTIAPGFTGLPVFRPQPASNWYFFAGIEGRIVGRNIFLDGNTFTDSHSVDKETLVGDLQFGFAFHFRNARIALINIIRSNEFEGQADRVQYGAINLTYYTD